MPLFRKRHTHFEEERPYFGPQPKFYTDQQARALSPSDFANMEKEALLSILDYRQFVMFTQEQVDAANEQLKALGIGIRFSTEEDGEGNGIWYRSED